MKVGSLFSGIGGIDLGLERAGMQVVWQVENDEFCQQILSKRCPAVALFSDVHECRNLPPVDLVCGGFPCQPVSLAGNRNGDEDERWLWPEFARIVREVGPGWVLVENVPGLLSADAGRLMGGILRDLAALGYDCFWDCIPAAAVGAPHLRDRVFIVGHTAGGGQLDSAAHDGKHVAARRSERSHADQARLAGQAGHVAHAKSISERKQEHKANIKPVGRSSRDVSVDGGEAVPDPHEQRLAFWQMFRRNLREELQATQRAHREGRSVWSSRCRLRKHPDGVSGGLDCGGWECGITRLCRKQGDREQRLKALGNAVVPQVAEVLGRAIMRARWQTLNNGSV